MIVYDHDLLSPSQQRAVADWLTDRYWVALRPIYVIGPVALWWSIGVIGSPGTIVVMRNGHVIHRLHLTWVGRTRPKGLDHDHDC